MKRLLFALFFTFVFSVVANSQTFRGAINGTVTDPSGAAVPTANSESYEGANWPRPYHRYDYGRANTQLQDIPLGLYKVQVTASGFPTYTIDKVESSPARSIPSIFIENGTADDNRRSLCRGR